MNPSCIARALSLELSSGSSIVLPSYASVQKNIISHLIDSNVDVLRLLLAGEPLRSRHFRRAVSTAVGTGDGKVVLNHTFDMLLTQFEQNGLTSPASGKTFPRAEPKGADDGTAVEQRSQQILPQSAPIEKVTRTLRKKIARSMREGANKLMLYPKCTVRNCKICITCYKTYPVTPCLHSGARCHDIGWFPHVPTRMFRRLHSSPDESHQVSISIQSAPRKGIPNPLAKTSAAQGSPRDTTTSMDVDASQPTQSGTTIPPVTTTGPKSTDQIQGCKSTSLKKSRSCKPSSPVTGRDTTKKAPFSSTGQFKSRRLTSKTTPDGLIYYEPEDEPSQDLRQTLRQRLDGIGLTLLESIIDARCVSAEDCIAVIKRTLR